MARYLTFVREPRKLPVVLSEEEIVRLLEAALIGRPLTLENTTDIVPGLPIRFRSVSTVAHETTGSDKVTRVVYRRRRAAPTTPADGAGARVSS
jgi:hypothetical protein